MKGVVDFINNLDGFVWGWWMIILLLGTHIFMTIRTGFIQRKTLSKGIKLSVSKDPDAEGEVSSFGALTTALAATIGTGNIIGVGTAVALGGPGAVLWCWLTGVFGIATKYAESLIAVKYRVKTRDGRMQEMAGLPVRALWRYRFLWHWLRYTGQCDRNCGTGEFPLPALGCRSRDRNPGRCRYLRRDQVYCKRLRETGSLYGDLLCDRMYRYPLHQL